MHNWTDPFCLSQFGANSLDEHLPGAIFDDKTPDHDFLSRFHQGAGREIDELAIGPRGRLRDPQQSRQDQKNRRRGPGLLGYVASSARVPRLRAQTPDIRNIGVNGKGKPFGAGETGLIRN